MKKAKHRVEKILSDYPETRDSDKLLWLAYLVIYHDLKNVIGEYAYRDFRTLLMEKETVTMESIRRMRQKFQESGKYIGNKRKFKLDEAEIVRESIRRI